MNTLDRKTVIIILSCVVVIALVVYGVLTIKQGPPALPKSQTATATIPFSKMPPIPVEDERILQKNLTDILAKGKEADCVSLSDPRYQFACHDLFKNK